MTAEISHKLKLLPADRRGKLRAAFERRRKHVIESQQRRVKTVYYVKYAGHESNRVIFYMYFYFFINNFTKKWRNFRITKRHFTPIDEYHTQKCGTYRRGNLKFCNYWKKSKNCGIILWNFMKNLRNIETIWGILENSEILKEFRGYIQNILENINKII